MPHDRDAGVMLAGAGAGESAGGALHAKFERQRSRLAWTYRMGVAETASMDKLQAMRVWRMMTVVVAGCVESTPPTTGAPDAEVRCVATGIADPRSITFAIEPNGSRLCADVPGILLDGGAPALFVSDPNPRQSTPRAIGALRCWGYAPGAEVSLAVSLELRVAPIGRATIKDCACHDPGDRVLASARVNGGERITLPMQPPRTSNSTCRDGPWHEGVYPLRADSQGEVRVELSLDRCQVTDSPARCLFVQGTRVRLVPPMLHGDR